MEATLMFGRARDRDLAIPELNKLGFEIEQLDWVDAQKGAVLSETVWITVRGISDLDENGFFHEMENLAQQFGGDVEEAGLADPLPPVA